MPYEYDPDDKFGYKDTLPENHPEKVITGVEFDDEFKKIAGAIESLEDATTGDGAFVDAPSDGQLYGRKDRDWEVISEGSNNWADIENKPTEFPPSPHTHPWGEITDKPSSYPPGPHDHDGQYVEEAPNDGKQYVRESEAWAEVDIPDGGTGSSVHIGDTPPDSPQEGQQWMEVPASGDATMWIYDGANWLQHPGGKDGADGADGADGVDGLWTDNGGNLISYDGTVTVNGELEVSSSTDTATIRFNNSVGDYTINNNQYGSIAINYNGGERFVLASNGDTYLYGTVNAPGVQVTGNLLAAKAGAGTNALAVGVDAGATGQGNFAVAVGLDAAHDAQGENGVAVGNASGRNNQGNESVSVGCQAGYGNQGAASVAVGFTSGYTSQGENAVAVGSSAGKTSQGGDAVAVGNSAGKESQGQNSAAVGYDAGATTQGESSVALGRAAGMTNQGDYAIAIGREAGKVNQGANGIIISSFGSAVDVNSANHIQIRTRTGSLRYNGSNSWEFFGGSVSGISFRQAGAPVIDAKGLISTLSTLRNATKDETTLQGMRDALADAIGGLIQNLEHEIATMPVEDSE